MFTFIAFLIGLMAGIIYLIVDKSRAKTINKENIKKLTLLLIKEQEESMALTNKITDLESKMGLIIDAAELGVWSLNVVTGELICNDKMFEIFQLDKSTTKFDSTKFFDAIIPEDADRIRVALKYALDNKTYYDCTYSLKKEVSYKIRGKGKYFYRENSTTPDRIIGICILV